MPYTFARNGLPYGEPQSLTKTLSLVNAKASTWGGKYRLKPPHREWGPLIGRILLNAKLVWQLPRGTWGQLWKVEMGTERKLPAVFLIRKVAPPVPVPPPEPLKMYTGTVVDVSRFTPPITQVAEYVKRKVPRVQCSGAVYTRYVSGTTTWSQHSDFPAGGNAIDLTCYVNDDYHQGIDVAATMDVQDVLVAACRAGAGSVHRIIFQDRQYVTPDFEPRPYTGVYHSSHVHVEGSPLQYGTPVDA